MAFFSLGFEAFAPDTPAQTSEAFPSSLAPSSHPAVSDPSDTSLTSDPCDPETGAGLQICVAATPPETDILPHINIGDQYQCEIPDFIAGLYVKANITSLLMYCKYNLTNTLHIDLQT